MTDPGPDNLDIPAPAAVHEEDARLSALLGQLVVVLVEPRVAVNVGTVIRAMKNMGLTQLRLVRPAPMAWERTQISAPRTLDMLEQITCFDSLDDALSDCNHLVGVTALMQRVLCAPPESPRALSPALIARAAAGERVALLFGREASGLHRDEINRCDSLLTIPTRTDYTSLNLAQAVLLTCYELRQSALSALPPLADQPPAEAAEEPPTESMRVRFLAQVEHSLRAVHFFKSGTTESVLVQLRRLLQRANPTRRELQLLTGIAIEVLKFAHLLRRGIIPKDLPPAAVPWPPADDPSPTDDPPRDG